jgi:NADPH2:quinone reductase
MHALASPAYGPLESLRIIDQPLPEPGAGQVRIRVIASALNPADFKSVTGEMRIPPGCGFRFFRRRRCSG